MKRMYTLIAVLFVFLGVAFFRENNGVSQSKHPTVGILQLMHHPSLDQIHHGFIAGLADEGFHEGKNLTIDYQNAQGDQSTLKTMANKLVNEHDNAIFAITTPAAQSVANSTTKIPIILGAVTNPQGAGLVKNNHHPGGNITGVSDQAPVAQQLALVKEFLPHAKSIGIIYTSSDNSASTEHALFVKEAKRQHVNLKSYTIANSNDLNQVSQTALNNNDALIVPTDNTIAGAMQTLVKNANAVNKPIFPAVAQMVKQGGVATYSINQYDLGVRGGRMTGKILKGENPAKMPIDFSRHGEPVLNLKQAHKLGLTVPKHFEHEAETKGQVFK
ncbi:MAG: ABC transporter substrate-binding protein [[Lactobacillus] timonensis]|uniref:tryptophan ABC transporter substrate-binding protein n=1 Tax=[Lactobacillus] timonensis TaxID=1970790 RepID=UPI002352D748|nr:tryptophan ABC transporter substrate-binding protein [[Lactobacillus] timonensis]MCI1925783.1 ABC transporter substrate-binding protein [[Lactobacillus] timonensis]MCI1957144.1 ABC transporter substrate-binding protein [[Lactobacillus] timonensis]MCI1970171.1 ABC transporter substrate-binding protein [[Lactobacillus] timonensis]MCI2006408.1 ABC transporter substrate-binding protein [[Lactobacillus] timonensis]